MRVTENLRAVMACLAQLEPLFLSINLFNRQAKTAIESLPIGHELPEKFTQDLRQQLVFFTQRARLENGQVYFVWGLNRVGVDLLMKGDDFTNIHNTTFTLDSLFEP